MQCIASVRQLARLLAASLLFLIGPAAAFAADTYNFANGQLTLPSVVIGGATYSNMIVTVGVIISGPAGTTANGTQDSYDPGTNQLTIQTVILNTTTFHNVVVTVASLVSIGGVTGANTYSGTSLSVPYVQVRGTTYSNVVVAVASVVSVHGGMPTFATNTYDPLTNRLAIPAVLNQHNNQVYTNVIITPGSVSSVGGISSSVAESLVHSFSGAGGTVGSNDGAVPSSLIWGNDANLYGATFPGGADQQGMIFKLSTAGAETILYSFTGNGGVAASTDGAAPTSLMQASDGNFYGTTQAGGAYNKGAVFSIAAGVEAVIYSFSGNGGVAGSMDGALPVALVEGSDGSLYGTTQLGGANGAGTAFNVTTSGVETVLYSFGGGPTGATSGTDGASPAGGLIQGSDGSFYGTTQSGGTNTVGTIFSLTTAGVETVLYSFIGGTDGASPDAGLVQGNDGNFYGTTFFGGAYSAGTVFSVTAAGIETVIHSFSGGGHVTGSTDGAYPSAGLMLGADGNLYGTTRDGGPQFYGGTMFKITESGVETVLYAFRGLDQGSTDGTTPTLGLISDNKGDIYGTTAGGGVYGKGVVFTASNAVASH
jgi:uncharacterized repeat protein (TIGR03803 family)